MMHRSAPALPNTHGASPVIEVAVTPNRPDCMGVYGIARDLAAKGFGDAEADSPCLRSARTGRARSKFAPMIRKVARRSMAG